MSGSGRKNIFSVLDSDDEEIQLAAPHKAPKPTSTATKITGQNVEKSHDNKKR